MYLRHVIVYHRYFYVYYRHYAAAFRGITIEIRPPLASIDFACSSLVINCKLCAKLPAGEILALNCHLMDKCSITCQMNLISPVGVANLIHHASECSNMNLNNKEYPQVEDFLARFNIYNIYTSNLLQKSTRSLDISPSCLRSDRVARLSVRFLQVRADD